MACVFCAAFLLAIAGDVLAVDKKKKDTPVKTEKQERPAQKKQKASREQSSERKYDNFIDRNQNGIDDRKENLKTKDAPKKTPEPEPTPPSK